MAPLRPWITWGTFTLGGSLCTPIPPPPHPPTRTHTRPPLCKIHSGYVNGNVITQPWRIYGPVRTHTNVFMTVSRALCKLILTGARTRLLATLPHQLSVAARAGGCTPAGVLQTDLPVQPPAAVPRPRLLSQAFLPTISLCHRPFNIHSPPRSQVLPELVLHQTNGITQTSHYYWILTISSFPILFFQWLCINFWIFLLFL